jgi:hypothetical protein
VYGCDAKRLRARGYRRGTRGITHGRSPVIWARQCLKLVVPDDQQFLKQNR